MNHLPIAEPSNWSRSYGRPKFILTETHNRFFFHINPVKEDWGGGFDAFFMLDEQLGTQTKLGNFGSENEAVEACASYERVARAEIDLAAAELRAKTSPEVDRLWLVCEAKGRDLESMRNLFKSRLSPQNKHFFETGLVLAFFRSLRKVAA